MYMEIIMQTIRIIDYENNKVVNRDIPDAFSDYVRQLIAYVDSNTSIRGYRTRSINTEVISCVLDIVKNQIDEDLMTDRMNFIAQRLLLKEREAQKTISNMDTNVQKGSLIQALLYDEDKDSSMYLLAKVEHTDFVDDTDFSFKSGFSKDTKKIWKSCIFNIEDIDADMFTAKVYSNTAAKYWYDSFLELEQVLSDEVNTEKAFRTIDNLLNRTIKKDYPRDYTLLRNSIITYFKTNTYIDYDAMVENAINNYQPVEIESEKMGKFLEKVKELPERHKFDKQFNTVSKVINARIRKVYDVCKGIQIKITDAIPDICDTIEAYRDDNGNKYLKIKTDNDTIYEIFSKEKI